MGIGKFRSHRQKTLQISTYYDPWIFWPVLFLLLIGLVMLYSASLPFSFRQYHDSWYFFRKQIIFLFLSLFCGAVIFNIPTELWKKLARPMLLLSVALLVVVNFAGHSVNGSQRWLHFAGLSFQVAEILKFTLVVYLADYLTRQAEKKDFQIFSSLRPLLLLMILVLMLLLQPDFGSAVLLTGIVFGMLFLAQIPLWQFMVLFGMTLISMVGVVGLAPYRLQRLLTFLNPWQNPFGTGYQLTQALISFGSGGTVGVGLGGSVQKLFYLPEAHTDFLFAIIGEELGLIGASLLVAIYLVVSLRMLYLGWLVGEKKRIFQSYLCYGFGISLGLQSMINIGVNIGVLPTKGLTLPLISYGGSSLLIYICEIACVLRIFKEYCQDHK